MSHVLIKRNGFSGFADFQELEVRSAGIGSTCQNNRSLARIFQIRFDRVESHIRAQSNGIGVITFKNFPGILLRRCADVATLGIQNDRDVRIILTDITADVFKLIFRSGCMKIGNLGFECTDKIGR